MAAPTITPPALPRREVSGPLGVLMLGALGVVYGDIGTSPLYTLKTAIALAGGSTSEVTYGMFAPTPN